MPINYQSIFQFAPVGMCVSDQRVIQASNDALAAMFGYGAGVLDGQSFPGRVPAHGRPHHPHHECQGTLFG
jgi:PAS domain-containing protein